MILNSKQSEVETELSIDVLGCVDAIDNNVVRGWVYSVGNHPVEILLVVDGECCKVNIERRERADVVKQYGELARFSGFVLSPCSKEVSLSGVNNNKKVNVDVLANGVSLVWRGAIPRPVAKITTEVEDGKGLLGSNVDSVEQFVIKGWALPHQTDELDIRLFVNGRILDCDPIQVERADVKKLYGEKAIDSGFEIYLPGRMWELADENGLCDVVVNVNNSRANKVPILLEYGDIARWVDSISERDAREDSDYLGLFALEHVKYGKAYNHLTERGQLFIQDVASRMGLQEYLCHEKTQAVRSAYAESVSALMLRQAMLELNGLMKAAESEIYPLVKQVYDKFALRGTAKEWYLNLAIQLTCTTGEFDKLKELSDFRYLEALHSSNQPHQLALLLPDLVRSGEIGKAIEIMHQIAKNEGKSWLPSSCISYAVSAVQQMEIDGVVDIDKAEGFRVAFISVLDGFKAGRFSRLHDERLVSTMVSLVKDVGFYTDHHKRFLVSAAIRHYGLSPTFWKKLQNESKDALCGGVGGAWESWKAVQLYMDNLEKATEEEICNALEALEYFQKNQNQEAVYALREVLMQVPDGLGYKIHKISQLFVQRFVLGNPGEVIRYCAHPLCLSGNEEQREVIAGIDMVYALRMLGDYQKSAVYDMQISASKALESIRHKLIARSDCLINETVNSELYDLERKSILLGTPQGMFLGVDILISVYQSCSFYGYRPTRLLMNAMEILRVSVAGCGVGCVLPAPICAAIARVSSVDDDPELICLMREMRSLLSARYGAKYDHLFVPRGSLPRQVSEHGLFQDTIVVIATSKKEIDGKCISIRETWLEELKSRGVPYLFVVGGEVCEVNGDVLEVDVSDAKEFRSEMILKTFEWVAGNMDVQYVVMVSDECFLNVGLYLDSMSYRKHHYYGKVIRCSKGVVNRIWHQEFAVGECLIKSIDKSRGDIDFVAGGYVSSLSRHAIDELVEAAKSVRGKRLRSSVYSEDKLIGDLLSLRNICPNDEDFDLYADAPVQHGLVPNESNGNAFFPGALTPGKVARISNHKDMCCVKEKMQTNEIWPKKIWPTCQEPSLSADSNQLELLTDTKKLDSLLKQKLVVVTVVRNEIVILPQFLKHYRDLGVKCFIFVDNCSSDGTREFLMQQQDVILYSTGTEYKLSHYGVSWQQAVMGNHCLGKWVLLADADEFLVYEGCESISVDSFINGVESSGDNGVLLYMVDMYPYGDLDEARFDEGPVFEVAPYFDREALIELRFGGGMYSNSRNYVNGLRHRLAPSRINAYVSQKYALFKYHPWVRLCEGAHYAANMQISPITGFFAHFKYHSGFKEKVEVEVRRKQHFNGAEEYLKYAEMISEKSGGFGVDGVSERFVDSHSFVRMASRLDGS